MTIAPTGPGRPWLPDDHAFANVKSPNTYRRLCC